MALAFVLGITGGIGTGKSTVLRMFGELGAQTLSADDIAREVLKKGSAACLEVVERFGGRVIGADGEVDRAALAGVIFSDADARKDLDAITHPRIIAQTRARIDSFRGANHGAGKVLAVEVPLLMECGLEGIVDKVLVVAAEQGAQVSRLTSRSGISEGEALSRIASQMPIEQKVARADRVIWNDGSLEELGLAVKRIWEEIFLL